MSTTIFEMAFEKKVAIDKARSLQSQIAYHLVKINMYSSSSLVPHWTKEVNVWLQLIQRNKLKGTNNPLNKQDLFKILFDEPLGTVVDVQDYMNEAHEEYPDLPIDQPSAAEVNKTLSWQLQGVCNDIANKLFKNIGNYQ